MNEREKAVIAVWIVMNIITIIPTIINLYQIFKKNSYYERNFFLFFSSTIFFIMNIIAIIVFGAKLIMKLL